MIFPELKLFEASAFCTELWPRPLATSSAVLHVDCWFPSPLPLAIPCFPSKFTWPKPACCSIMTLGEGGVEACEAWIQQYPQFHEHLILQWNVTSRQAMSLLCMCIIPTASGNGCTIHFSPARTLILHVYTNFYYSGYSLLLPRGAHDINIALSLTMVCPRQIMHVHYIYVIVIPCPWGLYGIYCLSPRAKAINPIQPEGVCYFPAIWLVHLKYSLVNFLSCL